MQTNKTKHLKIERQLYRYRKMQSQHLNQNGR